MFRRSSHILSETYGGTTLDNITWNIRHLIQSLTNLKVISKCKNCSPHPITSRVQVHRNLQPKRFSFDTCYQYVTSDQYTKAKIKGTKDLYVDAVDALPPNAPRPRVRHIYIICFVDSDHASDSVTRNSQTGILLFFNSAPIVFFPK